jgi:hypothetical protein
MSQKNRSQIVDGLKLSQHYRELLRPDEEIVDRHGHAMRLPRYFYEIPDWQSAVEWDMTEHFSLYEFLTVDLREADLLQKFPRYVPCAVSLLAAALEVFRERVGKSIHISANGGYRSQAHQINPVASLHSWACAANIYRIGDDLLDDRETIEKYAAIARKSLFGLNAKAFGHNISETDDHLHLDIGLVTVVPGGVL